MHFHEFSIDFRPSLDGKLFYEQAEPKHFFGDDMVIKMLQVIELPSFTCNNRRIEGNQFRELFN